MTRTGRSATDAPPQPRATGANLRTPQERGPASPADTDEQGTPVGVWGRLRAGGALAIGQLGVITALAFYFGWAHTQAYLRYFGLDTSLVQYTTADYALRSVGASYWPLTALALLVVAILAIDAHLSPWIRRKQNSEQRFYRRLIAFVGLLMLLVAAGGLRQQLQFPRSVPVIPLSITTGVGLVAYAWVLRSISDRQSRARRDVQLVAMIVVLASGIFWAWGDYVANAGTQKAKAVHAELPYRPDVTIYSADRLAISGHGVDVAAFGEDDSRYRFRYTGLRLLMRSEERYFLLPQAWERGQDAVIILTESESVRLEFWAEP
jgi:hypothetical protein